MDTIARIRAELQVAFGCQEVLDALVHDRASTLATAVNNDGLKAQLAFLNQRGMSDEDVLAHLQSANT